MNLFQVLRQLKYLLRNRKWENNSAYNVVFPANSVIVSIAPAVKWISKLGMPCAVIVPMDGQTDPEFGETPDLLVRRLTVKLCQILPGDGVGENVIMGANRTGNSTYFGQGASEGRGLLEIEEELFEVAKELTEYSGVRTILKAVSSGEPIAISDTNYLCSLDNVFDVMCTSARYYPPATAFTAQAASGGVVNLAWTVPPDRYDLFKVILRRATGSTAPTSITGGTGVTLSANLATSKADTGLSSGTYSYALFSTYDETQGKDRGGTPAANERISASVTRTVTVA